MNKTKAAQVVFLALALTALGLINTAEAGSFKFKSHDSGTFLSTMYHLSTDPNEGTAAGTMTGKSNKGQYIAQCVGGAVLTTPVPIPCTLPGGAPGTLFTFVGEVTVFHFDSTEDQLFAVSASGAGTECAASSGPPTPFHGTLSFNITGGTGRFAGASGTLTLDFDGQYLVFLNPASSGAFGWVADEWTGNITTP